MNEKLPSSKELEKELQREIYRFNYLKNIKNTIYGLITVAAVSVLVATLFLPVLEIYGASMEPTLYEGDIVVSTKDSHIQQGDIISFYYNNKILVKRAIAFSGDWVNIDEKGNVYVNGELLDEPYVSEKSKGECNIDLPYQVPEGKIFVCGDHRATSVDSRSDTIGCVSKEQIVGVIRFRVWPLKNFGKV